MRVLIVDAGVWTKDPVFQPGKFDRVFDLGVGRWAREAFEKRLQLTLEQSHNLDSADFRRMRELRIAGSGHVVDGYGIDWWELAFVKIYEPLERLLKLGQIAAQIRAGDAVSVAASSMHVQILACLTGRPFEVLQSHSARSGLRHYVRNLSRFSPRELLRITADKYDAGYRLRRLVAAKGTASEHPVVLLPSAYINATRTAMRYAEMLPETRFLLVATRASARVDVRPGNIRVANLSSYAPGQYAPQELDRLLCQWRRLKRSLQNFQAFKVLDRLGSLNFVPKFLLDGLAVRNAWVTLLDKQPVSAVLCTDEANPFTCLPVLIGRQRGLPTIACHHGALDGRYRFLSVRADIFLAKGRMEHQYMVRSCGVPSEKIRIGAPSIHRKSLSANPKRSVIFFSEPYEIAGGRSADIYQELLPQLANIAHAAGREIVVKLHPFESHRERLRLVNGILSPSARKITRIVAGPLNDELLSSTWCAVTIISTAAVDCALRGIPAFLCKWLDRSQYGYAEQFAKFGAGRLVSSAVELRDIPAMVEDFPKPNAQDIWEPIAPERLNVLLNGQIRMPAAV